MYDMMTLNKRCAYLYGIYDVAAFVFLINNDLKNQLKDAGSKLVVIDFFATWCGPCKIIAPRLEELAKEYDGKVVVLKVDVDECEDIAMEYNISSMPTFVFIKESQQIYSFAGANAEKLADYLEKNA